MKGDVITISKSTCPLLCSCWHHQDAPALHSQPSFIVKVLITAPWGKDTHCWTEPSLQNVSGYKSTLASQGVKGETCSVPLATTAEWAGTAKALAGSTESQLETEPSSPTASAQVQRLSLSFSERGNNEQAKELCFALPSARQEARSCVRELLALAGTSEAFIKHRGLKSSWRVKEPEGRWSRAGCCTALAKHLMPVLLFTNLELKMGSGNLKPHMLFCNNNNWRWRNSSMYWICDKGLAPEPIIIKLICIWYEILLFIAQKRVTSSEQIEVSKKRNSFCHGWRIKLENYFLMYSSLKLS